MRKSTISTVLLIIGILSANQLFAQKWVDTTYSIETVLDIPYGEAVDFAGTTRTLEMDISYPVGDTVPDCGRPLLVMVHGGAWLAGKRDDPGPSRIREDFAKRGYTTASITYRLGQFNTSSEVNCNVSELFDVPWNCLNMTDTSEWYRAYFRGIQDVNGAIRYLVNNASTYDINPDNVFVVGESAGAFIAMGVGFLDDDSEVLDGLTQMYPDAPAPHAIYEDPCIRRGGFADDIDSMDLSRPDLGSYKGNLNQPETTSYTIRGVGNLYGGVFNNIFQSNTSASAPALYMFHQPCDLIVPFRYGRVFDGYQACFFGFPASCGFIFRRPLLYGSMGIKALLDTMAVNGLDTIEYLFERTNNQWGCLQQTNPGQGCHDLDNYWLRTSNMAAFFAPKVDSCKTTALYERPTVNDRFNLYPNPISVSGEITITGAFRKGDAVLMLNVEGVLVYERAIENSLDRISINPLNLQLASGLYFVQIRSGGTVETKKMIVTD